MSVFRICNGKGFQIEFGNGYTVSVQFGPANYCDNYDMEWSDVGDFVESANAEIAIIKPDDGGFVPLIDDDVAGHVTPDQIAKIIHYVSQGKIDSVIDVLKYE